MPRARFRATLSTTLFLLLAGCTASVTDAPAKRAGAVPAEATAGELLPAGPAVAAPGGDCLMLAADGSLFSAPGAAVDVSADGRYTCIARPPGSAPRRLATFDQARTGRSCTTPAGATGDWEAAVTPTGDAFLTCRAR